MKQVLFVLVVIILAVDLFFGLMRFTENNQQQVFMNNTADCMIDYGKEGRTIPFIESLNATDVWGQKMKLSFTVSKEYHRATVTSLGRDGKPDTKDDWVVEKYNYNKSYQIGKLASEKAKEALDGLMDGIKEKGKFEEDSPTK